MFIPGPDVEDSTVSLPLKVSTKELSGLSDAILDEVGRTVAANLKFTRDILREKPDFRKTSYKA